MKAMTALSVWLAQLVKWLAAPTHVHWCVQEVWVLGNETRVLENFQTRIPGFVRRRKPGFDGSDFLAFSAICKSLVLAKLVTLNRSS